LGWADWRARWQRLFPVKTAASGSPSTSGDGDTAAGELHDSAEQAGRLDDATGDAQVVSVDDVLVETSDKRKVTSDLDFINSDRDQRREYARQLVRQRAVANARGRQELLLRGSYASVAGGVVLVQMGIADWFFYKYASSPAIDWDVPGPVILGWMSATVVQVVGILLVITRSLFPNHDKRDDGGSGGSGAPGSSGS
jgi:hypothetical protein